MTSAGPARNTIGTPGARPAPPAFGVRISGTGIGIPAKLVTNNDLAKIVDTNDEWIFQRTGIKQRYLVERDNGNALVELAKTAMLGAIAQAGIKPKEIDLLICSTMTSEMCCPSSGAQIVSAIGAVPAGAMDLSSACSGFVYAMNLAATLIEAGRYKTVAVVGVETLSRIMDWTDRRTCVLFGDGAGAAIFSRCDDNTKGCVYQGMGSNGDQWADLYVPRVEGQVPKGSDYSGHLNTMQMNGREVFKFAVSTLQRSIDEALNAAGLKASDLDMVISHQSNGRILESAREKLGLPIEKLYINIDRYGNTSAASVPICLHELREQGRIKEGNLVLFVGLGGGLSWATNLWRV
jgi:3-oxoacyl-[acyl-carrier-protein] synthase-3